jgi:hypothetical protein
LANLAMSDRCYARVSTRWDHGPDFMLMAGRFERPFACIAHHAAQ